MGGLLAELGKKLAERWLSLLVLPGALYLATVTTGLALGHAHPFDVGRLGRRIDELSTGAQADSSGRLAVVMLALLLAAAAVGVAAQAAGSATERLWLAAGWRQWPTPLRHLAYDRVARRRTRWTAAMNRYVQRREAVAAARARAHRTGRAAPSAPSDDLDVAYGSIARIATELPARPTWIGDRIGAVATRLDRDLGLDLATVWPHLWLTAPDTCRTEITAAREALTRATTLAGWGLLYLAAGALWWPAAMIAAAIIATAWRRARTVTDSYATLVEATVRLYAPDLARHLGLAQAGPLTRQTGSELTCLLQGQRSLAPPAPAADPPPSSG